NSINYDTPVFGGFQGMVSMSSTNASTALAQNAANAKERTISVAGVYRSGPLAIGLGYNENTKAYNAGAVAGDEDAWHINASYQLGSVKLGGAYTKSDADTAAAANAEVAAWHLGAEWKVQGPHNVHFGYTHVGDMKGTPGATMGTRQGVTSDLCAKLWQRMYVDNLSMRTNAVISFTHLMNDRHVGYILIALGDWNMSS